MPQMARHGTDAASVAVVPRDDRAWPRGSLTFSVALVIVAVAAGAWFVIAAGEEGPVAAAAVASVFIGAFAFAMAVAVPMMRHWVAGRRLPTRLRLVQATGFVVGFAVLVFGSAGFGWTMIAGMVGGTLVANAGAIRAARANRGIVDRAEAAEAHGAVEARRAHEAREAAEAHGMAEPAQPAAARAPHDAGRDVPAPRAPVGQALREVLVTERRRTVAWLIAAGIGVAVCLLVRVPDGVTVAVAATGVGAFAWVLRRWVGGWMALRSFRSSDAPPRRAFVVLLHDPAPRMIRPLLGVWTTAPLVQQGRIPRPEHVYRCDEELDGLLSFQGDAEVHEAWVDGVHRPAARPRWVAADAGVVLPHRRAWFGRWYLGRLLWGERPGRPRPLTLREPSPDDEGSVAPDPSRSPRRLAVAVAGRVVALAVVGLVVVWLS